MSAKVPAARLIVVLGAGGVGKTTSAAAMALRLAELGHRAVVITVDPAKRLAQALGLDSLSSEPREVFRNPAPQGGSLHALWIDSNTSFRDLVKRYAGNDSGERILNNRLFKIIQNQLGGIEEYLGVERLLTLARSGDFDVCVLDTPPSRHALDFLESPRHIIRFFDDTVLRAFVKDDEEETRKRGLFSRILETGRQQALEIFKNFLGKGFLAELGELLANLKPVHEAFTTTAEEIEAWVRSPAARFVGVSLFEPYPLDEVRLLGLELEARNLPQPQVLVLNKSLPPAPPPAAELLAVRIGAPAAEGLRARHEIQRHLRARLQTLPLSSLATAEVLRYSPKELDLAHLAGMGKVIFEAWQSKDPEFFSKNS